MDATELTFGIVILLQFSTGLSVNIFLLLFYARMVSASLKSSSSDWIFAHLALANTTILLTIGIPEVMSAWGLRNFLDDTDCKILMYLYRVARGLVICTTCLLSVFQAVTLSPGTSRWAGVKARFPKYIIPSCLLSWMLNLMIDYNMLVHMTGPQNSSSVQIKLDLTYCSEVIDSEESTLVITLVVSFRDLFFVGLMSLASGYMVFILHKHHRQVRHLHGPGCSPRATAEVRAAKRVVALVTLYVLFYGRQSIMLSVIMNKRGNSPLLVKSHLVFILSFSAISPFLIIHSDRRMRIFWKRESPFSLSNLS